MPLIRCCFHSGRAQGISLACTHIAAQVRARRAAGPATFVDLDQFMLRAWLCEECLELMNRSGLPEYLERWKRVPDGLSPNDEQSLRFSEEFARQMQPLCAACLRDALESTGGPAAVQPG